MLPAVLLLYFAKAVQLNNSAKSKFSKFKPHIANLIYHFRCLSTNFVFNNFAEIDFDCKL
jgi:hypothetical protein